jgi:hypothetical protein
VGTRSATGAQGDLHDPGRHLHHQGRGGAAVWDAARERAYAILAELEDAIRVVPTLDLADRVIVQLARVDLDQGPQDNGRWAALDIDIAVTAELVSN